MRIGNCNIRAELVAWIGLGVAVGFGLYAITTDRKVDEVKTRTDLIDRKIDAAGERIGNLHRDHQAGKEEVLGAVAESTSKITAAIPPRTVEETPSKQEAGAAQRPLRLLAKVKLQRRSWKRTREQERGSGEEWRPIPFPEF